MDFEELLVRFNEMSHRSIQKFKRQAIGRGPNADVTIAQLYYIEAIFRLKRPSLNELARELRISKASASTGVHKLMGKGLAKAEQSPQDRRVYFISLTADGRRLIDAEKNSFREFSQLVRRTLTEREIRVLGAILEKVTKTGME
jgi:MarR family transcriptional regulator for hemolysin